MSSVTFIQAIRAHSALKPILQGNEYGNRYLRPATIQEIHPISKCFQRIQCSSIHYVGGSVYENVFDKISINTTDHIFSKPNSRSNREWFLDVEKIKSVAHPAPFGKGSETVLDTNVRKAFEIKGGDLTVDYGEGFDKIQKELQKLAPEGKVLVPKLYKLQMYEVGGHFKRHRDTVHSTNHYGTLIVGLPTNEGYEGGEFVLYPPDREPVTIDLQVDHWQRRYAVFLTDLEHEVNEVTEGVRVVLQFDLYLEPASPTEGDKEHAPHAHEDDSDYDSDDPYSDRSHFEKDHVKLREPDSTDQNLAKTDLLPLLDDFHQQHPGDNICFLLTHRYPLAITADNLRAADKVLFDMLVAPYEVELGLAINRIGDWGWDSPRGDRFHGQEQVFVMDFERQMRMRKFIETGEEPPRNNGRDPTEIDEGNETDDEASEDGQSGPRTHLFFGSTAKWMKTHHEDYIEFTGNEAAAGQYVYASIVLGLGPRRAQVEK
ncbi:hypothetical protein HK097_009788 [Rhizophlyctis rosea]|uniref:Fe2OG dioxygenase domain-containing protein n=1 Tax=Rhizophlyctis rosea TaxID=64517 RepID=A0AAD5SIZ1_9FUNG|nr:hypothetical protein HK097_009788 [Rhizophlyctis rosea]